MKVTETESEIVICDRPVFFWLIGAFGLLMFGGGFLMLLYFAISDPREAFSSQDGSFAGSVMAVIIYFGFLLFLAALTGLFGVLALSSAITTTVDGRAKTITIERRNLLRKKIERYEAHQVKGFEIEETRTRRGPIHNLCLRLKNDEQVDIEGSAKNTADAEGFAQRLNSFLGIAD